MPDRIADSVIEFDYFIAGFCRVFFVAAAGAAKLHSVGYHNVTDSISGEHFPDYFHRFCAHCRIIHTASGEPWLIVFLQFDAVESGDNHIIRDSVSLFRKVLADGYRHGIIAADEKDPEHQSGHQNRAWYKTIVVNLKRFAENDERKYLQLLEKPFASAELLLGNNSAEALDFLCQVE